MRVDVQQLGNQYGGHQTPYKKKGSFIGMTLLRYYDTLKSYAKISILRKFSRIAVFRAATSFKRDQISNCNICEKEAINRSNSVLNMLKRATFWWLNGGLSLNLEF